MPELLEVTGLSAGYGPLTVLHDLHFTVSAGERVGIVGLNGHGKSTLLGAVMGLTGWQSGSIRLDGAEIGGRRSQGAGRNTHRITWRGVTLMPQGDAIFPGLSVAQHLDIGAWRAEVWRGRERRREEMLEVFPALAPLLAVPVGRLSGGERRMVSLARGLMSPARLLLIDEPSLGLAPKVSQTVMQALLKISLEGSAMVIAEQNVALLAGRMTRLIGMHAGKFKGDAGHAATAWGPA